MSVPIERKPVGLCNFLLVINTNWHPISYRFEVLADYCSNYWQKTATAFLAPFRGLVATYTVHLRLIWKRVVNFLLVLIELFLPGACYERILIRNRRFWRGVSVSCSRRCLPQTTFAQMNRPVNALQLCRWQYSHKETL